MNAQTGSGGMFRGWWVAIAGFLALVFTMGSLGGALPILNSTLEEELLWSRDSIAIGFAFFLIGAGVFSPLTGLLVERFGPRAVMSLGTTMLIVFVALLSMMQDYVQFLAIMCGVGAATVLVSIVPVQKLVTEWFVQSRGAAMGLAMAGGPLGTAIMAIVTSWLFPAVGFRTAFLIYAAFLAVTMIPLLLLMIRNTPASVGLKPLGAGAVEAEGESEEKPAGGPGLVKSLLSPAFIFLFFLVLLSSLGTGAPPVHFAFLAKDQGFDLTAAAIVVAVFAAGNVLGTLFFGWLADRANKRAVISAVNILGAIAVATMLIYGMLPLLLAAAFAFGLCWGALFALWPVFLSDQFGTGNFAALMGIVSLAVVVGWAVAPIVAGLDSGANGSYNLSFGIFAGMLALGGILIALVRLKPPRE